MYNYSNLFYCSILVLFVQTFFTVYHWLVIVRYFRFYFICGVIWSL